MTAKGPCEHGTLAAKPVRTHYSPSYTFDAKQHLANKIENEISSERVVTHFHNIKIPVHDHMRLCEVALGLCCQLANGYGEIAEISFLPVKQYSR